VSGWKYAASTSQGSAFKVCVRVRGQIGPDIPTLNRYLREKEEFPAVITILRMASICSI
jgi:hypothetical protein